MGESRVYSGWWIVAGLFVVLTASSGFGVNAYPRIFSLSNALTVLGVAGGPALLGMVFDAPVRRELTASSTVEPA